ncbi:hypothetical protein [Bacillus cereus]|uniref:hypothetical protein n=1 Tax=Bacillus cereus TaxID=1396 RepID=UPI0025A2658D|nr:hypothetical protein [Bacillus cereus]MDM5459989.1 hypothetical protein [Bacillus cereus]
MKVMNMQETTGNVKYEESTRNFDELLKEAQRIADKVDKSLKEIESDPIRKRTLKEIQAHKEKAEFDKFYAEHEAKYGSTL